MAEDENTKALLERMKETVEGMKRRRSEAPRMSIAMKAETETERNGVDDDVSEDEDEGSDKENDSDIMDTRAPALASATEEELEQVGHSNESTNRTPTRPLTTTATAKTPHLDLKHIFQNSAPKTPSFKGVREMFQADDKVEPKTPKMNGMREMFRENKVPQTPAFEGVGEMMQTPAAYRMNTLEEEDSEEEEEVQLLVKPKRGRGAPVTTKPPSMTPTTRHKTPKSVAATTKTPITEGRSNFADDEATPGDILGNINEDEEEVGSKKPVARRGRSKAADSGAEEGGEKVQKKARLIRGSKKIVDDIAEVCSIGLILWLKLTC